MVLSLLNKQHQCNQCNVRIPNEYRTVGHPMRACVVSCGWASGWVGALGGHCGCPFESIIVRCSMFDVLKYTIVNLGIHIADRKTTCCIKNNVLRCFINPAALPLVRYQSIMLPRRVAS